MHASTGVIVKLQTCAEVSKEGLLQGFLQVQYHHRAIVPGGEGSQATCTLSHP